MDPKHTPYCLVALAAVGLLAVPATAAPDQNVTDRNITDAIEDEYIFDRAVPSYRIDVETSDGIVTLTGTTGNVLAKKRAARLAETVKGVKSVINRISIKPSEDRSDAAIEGDIESAWLADPAIESYEIEADVDDGMATLTGTVHSWQEKQLAEKVAMGVRGVTGVENDIAIEYKSERTDREIETEVEKALRWDALVDHALIDVKATGGKVNLMGTVGSAAEKRQARYDAWVAGVEEVNVEGLDVEKWARDKDLRKDKYVTKSAKDIEQAVKDALLLDPRVLSFNVTPEVVGSTVTLRGTVDNLKARHAAEQVARNTVGVWTVTNRIKVRPVDVASDTEIAQDVRDALRRNPYVDKYEITVSVEDGVAYLYGNVDSYFEKAEADEAASKTAGVVSVRNNLDVDYVREPLVYEPYVYDYDPYAYDWYDYEPYMTFATDTEIRQEVQDELWWSPFVDSDQVSVSVDDGVVTLTGTVDTYGERSAAVENAYEGGAVWVDNDLNVRD